MRRVLQGVGIVFVIIAASLFLLTAVTWPPQGLFFGLPFFFLIPALIFGIAGGLSLLLTLVLQGPPPPRDGRGHTRSKKSSYTYL
jgi:hypothetical protein